MICFINVAKCGCLSAYALGGCGCLLFSLEKLILLLSGTHLNNPWPWLYISPPPTEAVIAFGFPLYTTNLK
ncbi:hypothetical protein V8C40DRAFT_247841 [Trichoderma camerunense]